MQACGGPEGRMREIVLDTETTGLDPFQGHRIVEVGCVELINRIPSGQSFQRYVNPERDIPAEAFAVHGLALDFLRDKPRFSEIAEELLEFIGDAPLVIHNAGFDIAFLNSELDRAGLSTLSRDRLVDTLTSRAASFPAGPIARRPVHALRHRSLTARPARRAARR